MGQISHNIYPQSKYKSLQSFPSSCNSVPLGLLYSRCFPNPHSYNRIEHMTKTSHMRGQHRARSTNIHVSRGIEIRELNGWSGSDRAHFETRITEHGNVASSLYICIRLSTRFDFMFGYRLPGRIWRDCSFLQTRFATMEDIKSNAMAELRKIPKKPSTAASNNSRIDGASVCARKDPTLKVIR
jgi:hypothetical protein